MPEPLTVWAPAARTVEISLPSGPADDTAERLPLEAREDGWWATPEALPPGTDYLFHLDGGFGLPDPRSAWQPYGVHGPSRVFDASAYEWQDEQWKGRSSLGAVIYELHVGTFTPAGTLDAAIERLDHLVDLGVDMVELMPVAAFPGEHGWGYDGVTLYAVHEPYGGPEALQRFVDAAHARGLAVCLDVVYNHLGPSGNYLGPFGPYFTDRHETPWGSAVNLDGPDAGPVRRFVVENALRWLRDFHLDALRLDAVHALIDDSPRHVLAELSDAVAELEEEVGRPLSLVAESDLNDARMVTPTAEGGLGMTAQWDDDVHHALHARLTGERHGYYVSFGTTDTLRTALAQTFVHAGTYSEFRDKVWGAPVPAEVDTRRFVVFTQNHDQVGNRAIGDRPSRVLSDGQLAVSAAIAILGPYTPMLFMGEEWGATTPFQYFTDHAEPELAEAIRKGRTEEFASHGWEEVYGGDVEVPDPQSPGTVEASRLDWSEPGRERHARLLAFYRDLIALRHAETDIACGVRADTGVTTCDDGGWIGMYRGSVAIIANLEEEPREIHVRGQVREVVLSWTGEATADGETLTLPGHDVVVLRV
ncbi:maltooligosyl trehalose hydrolase [Georgenia satyanarayanai]|uniref:Malto-oligosyltrehalose trehalohydrolase n=1 Tax=Georgenia satyanarayanai TaxID=860221 RepID=A0A2Y8ZXR4_9MICO|nr:malto-oligosyltrehalose trehalohydrolase [Georgenia satyanarayanai]PYG02063.1 maltooligosyl trehalose hydrolase [Georgenia satyanarayanai]SSA36874.1 maltooligosyl trehalose hydrolase [Georgenia satyanarayanai]